MAAAPVVLALPDTTSLNDSTHPATALPAPSGSQPTGVVGRHVHRTLAGNPDGTPLGRLDVQCWARAPEEFAKRWQTLRDPFPGVRSGLAHPRLFNDNPPRLGTGVGLVNPGADFRND